MNNNHCRFYCLIFFLCFVGINYADETNPNSDDFLNYFDFIGYTRIGTGMSSSGDTQARFQAPGAPAAYRLGNESNIGLEAGLRFTYPLDRSTGKKIEALYFVSDYQSFGDEKEFYRDPQVLQAYVNLEKVLRSDLNVWFGRMYYERKDIHLNDYFWLDNGLNAKFGAGIELATKMGELKLAAFHMEDDDDSLVSHIKSYAVDARLLDIELTKDHKLNLFAEYVSRDGGDPLTIDGSTIISKDKDGFGLGLWVDSQLTEEITNTAVLLYRQGAAFRQYGTANPIREDQGYDLDDAHYWEINNSLVYDSDAYSVGWGTVIRAEEHGNGSNSKLHWLSTGIRPIVYLTDHVNIAIEAGVDYVDNEALDVNGQLTKVTAALQLSKSRGYYSRPVLRLFATQAYWSEDFEGLVGNSPDDAPYAEDRNGFSVGIQFEHWW
ncbi:hypothetical protein A9Q78_06335 [Methylophaga sp. 41_12_T18]|nr:hypothetical protein A9Q78_06335 [Methylophaga sp. 41_12_T18]